MIWIARDMLGSRVISPFFSRAFKMAHHAVRRADAEVVADFANRRPIAAAGDFFANKFKHFALPGGKQCCSHDRTPPIGFRVL